MKYKYLEYLRAFAALVVFINHIVGKLPYLILHKSLVLQSIGAWGTEAVIIFFLLSGAVINHTVKKYKQDTKVFLQKRAIRILPIYYVCIILTILIDYITNFHSNSTINYWGSIFFVATLQGTIAPPLSTIAVVWSLSFEVFFYLVFSFTIGKYQGILLRIWIFVAFVSLFLFYIKFENKLLSYFIFMFSFSSLWLFGYFIYEYKNKFRTTFSTAIFAFSMIPLINRLQISPQFYDILVYLVTAFVCLPIFVYSLSGNEKVETNNIIRITYLHYIPIYLISAGLSIFCSKSMFISKLMYMSLPLISLLLLNSEIEFRIKNCLKKIDKFLLFTASISYALYLIHMPIIFLFGRLLPNSLLLNLCLIIIFSFAISTFLEHYFQKRISKFFNK